MTHETSAGGHAPGDAVAAAGSERETAIVPPAGPAAQVDLFVAHRNVYVDQGTGWWRCLCGENLTGQLPRAEADRLWREHLAALLDETRVDVTKTQAALVMHYVEGWLSGEHEAASCYLREHIVEISEQMVDDDCAVPDENHLPDLLHRRALKAEEERERLARWKAEATEVIRGLHELAEPLGIPLGVLVTGPVAVEAAAVLRGRVLRAEASVGRVIAVCDGWDRLSKGPSPTTTQIRNAAAEQDQEEDRG